MSVVANVAINVDASKALQQLKSVDAAVDNLAKSAAAAPSKISGGIDSLGIKMQALGSKFATLGGAVASLGAGAALKGFLDAGIAAERTGKTINALAGSYKEVAGVNKIADQAAKEFGIGQTTAAKAVADLYGRLRPMGISLDDIGKTFNGVNKAAGLMNLTAADTDGVILQLSQAMGSGALQGDELRSVMERLPAVGQAIAKVMGVTVGEVKKLGADGKITTDIIIKAMDELNKLKPPAPDAVKLYTAAVEDLQTSIGTKLLPTFTPFLQALTGLINSFSALPQPLQNVIVGIGGFVAVLTLIAAPLGFLISGIGSLMTALAAAKIGATIAGWAAVAGPAITAISAAFTGLLSFLTGTLVPGIIAVFSGPAGWTVLAVAAVVAMVALFREPIMQFFYWIGGATKKAFSDLMGVIQPIFVQPFIDLWNNVLRGPVTAMFNWISGYIQFSMQTAYALAYAVFALPWIALWDNVLRAPVSAMVDWLRGIWTGIATFFNNNVVTPIRNAWISLTDFLPKAMASLGKNVQNIWTGVVNTIKAAMRNVLQFIANSINVVGSQVNRLISGFNRLPGPDIPFVPTLSVPQFAKGGVVSGPTLAMVGEGGEPEYIIPQSKMAKAAANYLNGARGSAVIPAYANGGFVGGNAQINVTTGPVMQQGGQQYVTLADLEKAMRRTADGIYASLRTPAGRYAVGTR